MSIELVMPSNQLILCHPLLLLPSIFPSIRVFSNESALRIRWPKYLSFSCSISPSNEYSGMTSFQIDWLDLLAVQGTLKVFSNTTVHLMSTGQSSFKNLDIKHIMKRTSQYLDHEMGMRILFPVTLTDGVYYFSRNIVTQFSLPMFAKKNYKKIIYE